MSCPNDKEVLKELVRTIKSDMGIKIQVCWITWPHPHEPKSHWHTVEILPVNSPAKTIRERKQALLENEKYFTICKECKERNPIGWMNVSDYCDGCAQLNHGIVF